MLLLLLLLHTKMIHWFLGGTVDEADGDTASHLIVWKLPYCCDSDQSSCPFKMNSDMESLNSPPTSQPSTPTGCDSLAAEVTTAQLNEPASQQVASRELEIHENHVEQPLDSCIIAEETIESQPKDISLSETEVAQASSAEVDVTETTSPENQQDRNAS